MPKDEYKFLGDEGLKLTLFFVGIILVSALIFSVVNPKQIEISVGDIVTTPERDTLYAEGIAIRKVSPDLLRVSLGVETQKRTARESQSENVAAINGIKASLMANGVAENNIRTSQYSVYPVTTIRKVCPDNRGCSDEEAQWIEDVVGYKTIHMLTVESTDLDSSGTIVDSAVRAGANKVTSVSFTLKDATRKEVEDSLATEAMADARAKAGRIASGLGVRVGKVLSASMDRYYYPEPRYKNIMAEASYDIGTGFSPGELTLTAYSRVAFEIAQ